jgi:hypothetical protein
VLLRKQHTCKHTKANPASKRDQLSHKVIIYNLFTYK